MVLLLNHNAPGSIPKTPTKRLIIVRNYDLDLKSVRLAEINNRISKASSTFRRLREKVWERRGISLETKLKVYRAVVLTTLLYGSETWTVYRRHERSSTTSTSDAFPTSVTSAGRTKSPIQRVCSGKLPQHHHHHAQGPTEKGRSHLPYA